MSSLAAAILASHKPAPAAEPAPSDRDVAAEAAAKDLLDAIEAKDAKRITRALRAARTIDSEE